MATATAVENEVVDIVESMVAYKDAVKRREDEKKLADQQALVDEDARITVEYAAEMAALNEGVAIAERERDANTRRLAESQAALVEASRKKALCELDHSIQRNAIRVKLQATAPQEIAGFIRKVDLYASAVNERFRAAERPTGRTSANAHEVVSVSNIEAIGPIREQCKAARAAAEALKLKAMPTDEVVKELSRLRGSIDGMKD